jgi:metal-dependent amidase/aminoacylase/carboxypeptidase family protein
MQEEKIKKLATQYFEAVKTIRRHLHQHPELSFQEFQTSAYIQERLKEAGIAFTTGHVTLHIHLLIEGSSR